MAIVDFNEASGQEAAQELNGKFYKTNVTDYDNLANTFAQVYQDHGRLDMGRSNSLLAIPQIDTNLQ